MRPTAGRTGLVLLLAAGCTADRARVNALDPAMPGNDPDGDGIGQAGDSCPQTPNPAQADADGDGLGDA